MVRYTFRTGSATATHGAVELIWLEMPDEAAPIRLRGASLFLSEMGGQPSDPWFFGEDAAQMVVATGRIQGKQGPDESTTYTYHNSGGGCNKVKKVDGGNGYATEYQYDGFGRMTRLTETIENSPFAFEYAYDGHGNISSITYPTGFKVNHTYSTDGMLTAVTTSTGQPIYALSELNALGLVKEYALGNGITTEKFFNAFGMVEDIIANGVMEHTYGWDAATGNLDWRADQIEGLIEEFDYDALDRLKEAQVDNGTPLTVSYEDNGNIELKSDVGEYTYMEDKVNAVRTVTNPDEQISLETQFVNYTTFDRTADISEGMHKAVFHYGPAHDRRKMEMRDNATDAVTSIRYYVEPYEELHLADGNTYKLHYILGGDGLAAIHVIHQPAMGAVVAETFFVYKDHLGSLVALTDADGNVVHRQSFDAWGKRRNPDRWTYEFTGFSQPTLSDPNMPDPAIWLNRGYTGHEHLDEFVLINTNNRMYDPEQGRMLAPDNFVQDPYNTQSYNRYAYVFNSPLSYTDPSGEIAGWIVSLIATAGSYLMNAGINNSWNPNDWSSGMVGFGVGYGGGGGYLIGGGNIGGNYSVMAGGGGNGNYQYGYQAGPGLASTSMVPAVQSG